jgi:Leucine-rich repeat (LRR) protein
MKKDLENLQEVRLDDEGHDQLPGVEEIQTTHRVHHQPGWPKLSIFCAFLLALLLVVSTIALSFALKARRVDHSASSDDLNYFQQVVDFVAQYSDKERLTDPTSPQFRAAHWMAVDDNKRLAVKGHRFLQRYALMTLFFSTGGENWLFDLHFASPDRDECHWSREFRQTGGSSYQLGVACNSNEEVTLVKIDAMGLNGKLPPELSLMTRLEHLSLNSNSLSGAIPNSLHAMTQLTYLSLAYNNYATILPKWLGNLNNLMLLKLSNNNFKHSIPRELNKLTSLEVLALNNNALSGNLSVVEQMTWLEHIYLDNNRFTGILESHFMFDSKRVKVLSLSENQLRGLIPSGLFQHSGLRVLDLHGNMLDGPLLPRSIPHSGAIEILKLHDNFFSGTIPSSINNLLNLQHLDVSSNRVHGAMPLMGSLSKMTHLNLSSNNFTASTLPPFLKGMSMLRELSFRATNRVGTLPPWIGSFRELGLLDLDSNHLTGQVPRQIGSLQKLEYLLLGRNKLTGKLPISEFQNMSNLSVVLIENNTITGVAGNLCMLNLDTFVSDCSSNDLVAPKFTCPCCTQCCPGPKCNQAWLNSVVESIYLDNFDYYETQTYSFSLPAEGSGFG